jgi:hypothetical protein
MKEAFTCGRDTSNVNTGALRNDAFKKKSFECTQKRRFTATKVQILTPEYFVD